MDAAQSYLDGLLDELWRADLRRAGRPDLDALEEQSSRAGGEAQARYEAGLIAQARSIVDGKTAQAPTREHLRVLLERLDGALPAPLAGEETPF